MHEDRMGHGMFHLGADNKVTVVGGYNQQVIAGLPDGIFSIPKSRFG
jgi:hypothetical protein